MARITNAQAGARGRAEVSRSNIPPIEVKKIVDFIEAATESPVVIIGGRAVNIWTKQHWRPSHDIDVVLGHKPTAAEFDAMNEYASLFGARFEINGDPASASRMKLKYYSGETDGAMPDGFVKIDLYYPGYVSSVNDRVPRNDIGGVPIWDIIGNSKDKNFVGDDGEHMEFRVASIPHMLIMKLSARESEMGRGDKDSKDSQAIIQISLKDRYELSINIRELRRDLTTYFPKDADRKFDSIFDNALDYRIIPGMIKQSKYIRMRLEEIDRDTFSALKHVKKKIQTAHQ